MSTRPYTLKRRAEQQEHTRRRIIDAVVALHEEVGPARTTIVEVAERAGVSRPTVYSHFPDEASLLRACSGHWLAQHPMPDVAAWASIDDPRRRLRTALADLYAYYGEHRRMLGNIVRDAGLIPALGQSSAARFEQYGVQVADVLVPDGKPRALAALHLALAFHTWQALTRVGMSDGEAAELMAELIERA